MKQTAVEWLEYNLIFEPWAEEHFKHNGECWNKAKAIEKEQIIEAWDNGYANGYDLGKHDDQPNPDDAEQYYNETFKSE